MGLCQTMKLSNKQVGQLVFQLAKTKKLSRKPGNGFLKNAMKHEIDTYGYHGRKNSRE